MNRSTADVKTVNIAFRATEEDKQLILYRAKKLGFTSGSDYIRHLVNQDMESEVESKSVNLDGEDIPLLVLFDRLVAIFPASSLANPQVDIPVEARGAIDYEVATMLKIALDALKGMPSIVFEKMFADAETRRLEELKRGGGNLSYLTQHGLPTLSDD